MKLVLLDTAALASNDLGLDIFQQFGEVSCYDRTPPELVAERIGTAEIAFTNKSWITNQVLDACPNLKYIGVFATGYNVIEDIQYAAKKGITICNVPEYSTSAVAQNAFAHILSFYNKIEEHNQSVHQGDWQNCKDFSYYFPTYELLGKTLGIIGCGSIGCQMAAIATAFGLKVLAYTRTPKPELEQQGIHFVSLDELLRQSDIVSIHCPLTEQTEHLINQEQISKMKPTALLINTARGPIIDEQALADALNSGKIAGAGIDVVSQEPILSTNPLLKAKNCHITPHIAWASYETRSRLLQIAVDNLHAFLNGNPQNKIN